MIDAANAATMRPQVFRGCEDEDEGHELFIERIYLPHVCMVNAISVFDPLDLRRVTGHFRTERWENLQHELHSSHFCWKPIDKNRCKLPATFVPNDRNKFSARITQFSLLPEADRQKLLQISEILALA